MSTKEVRFVRLSEAARRLDIPLARTYDLAAKGRIPVVKLARRTMRVPEAWFEILASRAIARVERNTEIQIWPSDDPAATDPAPQGTVPRDSEAEQGGEVETR